MSKFIISLSAKLCRVYIYLRTGYHVRDLSESHLIHKSLFSPNCLPAATQEEPTGVHVFGAGKEFLELLESRSQIHLRTRGLLTVSNHISVFDDPLMWTVLPSRCLAEPDNFRWSLASHDICFSNWLKCQFFFAGQALPTHRLAHSKHGGPFQPTIEEAIRILSNGPFDSATNYYTISPKNDWSSPRFIRAKGLHGKCFSTNGLDGYEAPATKPNCKYGWVHIFPEGRISDENMQPLQMHYFKWGVARLILEADTCPDVLPIWLSGFKPITKFTGKFRLSDTQKLVIAFGRTADQTMWSEDRAVWQKIRREVLSSGQNDKMVVINNAMAVALRSKVAAKVKQLVENLRNELHRFSG